MPDSGESAFWGYEDLALFLGAILPCGFLGAVLVRALHIGSTAGRTLFFQCLLYAILIGALYLLVALRYQRPFWRSLGWFIPERGLMACIIGGPILAVGTSMIGALLRAREVNDPIRNLITTRGALIVVLLFLVAIGPIFEELVFRGFLYPLLARSFGAGAGIVLTALPFALLHGAQNEWEWQRILVIGIAGVVFGYARYKTGSTAASTLLHSGFNLVGAVAYAAQWERGVV